VQPKPEQRAWMAVPPRTGPQTACFTNAASELRTLHFPRGIRREFEQNSTGKENAFSVAVREGRNYGLIEAVKTSWSRQPKVGSTLPHAFLLSAQII